MISDAIVSKISIPAYILGYFMQAEAEPVEVVAVAAASAFDKLRRRLLPKNFCSGNYKEGTPLHL